MSKPTYKRSERVRDQMKREIADILMRKIKDPRIGFVTVTDVELSDDLKNAKVFVSTYGGDREATFQGLKSASAFIRSELGRRLTMRSVPELLFRFDSAVEQGAHIMELLREIEHNKEKDGDGGPGGKDSEP
ncbi:MAG TPA: 30S ribosome-binding factor RbfA [Nitrospirota bacterium]